MVIEQQIRIQAILSELFNDSKNDGLKMIKGFAKSFIRPMQPTDFKDAYLSITKEQGEELIDLIKKNDFKNIVEFGTSFGISTLYLAQGALETNGHIITTELIKSKAEKAIENFESAGVGDLIEVRIGDAMETLKNHTQPIDFLLLDGWKDLYLPLFQMLKPNFHANTLIYVDNANMTDTKAFLKTITKDKSFHLEPQFDGKVVLVTKK
jgi:predicted O-methyltransferase YrrM